ncbi:MAG: aconitate hydratase, partial [Dehalococcoidia bacterium]
MAAIESTPDLVRRVYARTDENLAAVRRRLGRPLTLSEKILYGHLDGPENQELVAGKGYLLLKPDRIAMQDATAQMALLQFMLAGRDTVAVPATVHCDHLIQARTGALADLQAATSENREVYDFLQSVSQRYGLGFWKPGSGIIHQVVLENYAFPGGLMIGTDSHMPNAGGLGMVAVGVGGADVVDVMAEFPWELANPGVVGVKLTGELSGWTAPKDIILYLCGLLTVSGGTNRIIEYFGPGTGSISCTGKATICNMGAELGATCSIFPYDSRMAAYLRATRRGDLADLADANRKALTADAEVEADPQRFYDRVVEIDLSRLEPHVVGPHTPDLARPVSRLAEDVARHGYPDRVSAALVGSCTNSSYEDISRSADVAEQARAHGGKVATAFLVTPGSEQVRATIERDGQMAKLERIGANVLANACGPCIGQWQRQDMQSGQRNSIISSFNRNFPKRNDGNAETMAFIASPEIVVAFALAGRLSFNPLTDTLTAADGSEYRLEPPAPAPDLPAEGFSRGAHGYVAPPKAGREVPVKVAPDSQRLQLLEPFAPWDGSDFERLPVLLKAKGKCTTDHVSPAGPWLRYRGHLDKISDNAFLGVVNAFTDETGAGLNPVTGESGQPFPQITRDLKERGLRWAVVGDGNYGEGSSREHAAMSPRYLGVAAVITRSFARIHESNLKKQGVLPLTFVDPAAYDHVLETDRISIVGLASLTPGKPLKAVLHHADGADEAIELAHTLN